MDTQMRTWAEISLSALKHNYDYLRSLAPNSFFLGLCKANAYGHDVSLIAPALVDLGAEMLAVACVSEAVAIRNMGIIRPILVLGHTHPEQYPLLLEHNLTQTIYNIRQGDQLNSYLRQQGKSLDIHCKLDTGMGRLGIFTEYADDALRELLQIDALPRLRMKGVFTHFSSSEDENKMCYTIQQYNKFRNILQNFHKDKLLYHCANSGAVLNLPIAHEDMIRSGIALYGYSPDGKPHPELKPVLKLKTRIAVLRNLHRGKTISYGETVTLQRNSQVAVLPIGYGDGLSRQLSGGFEVKIRDQFCPILGKICMDMTMIDVTDMEGIDEGEEVTIYGTDNLLLQASKEARTIPYELLCNISPRVPRMLVDKVPLQDPN